MNIKSELSLSVTVVNAIKSRWYFLQPVCVDAVWYLGDWDGNRYVELLADSWMSACAEINDIRDYISANY